MPTKQTSDEQWLARKETIESSYIEKDSTLDELVCHLRNQGLDISKGQLVRKLKQWNISKNLTGRQWKAVIKLVNRRRAEGKESVVSCRGHELPAAKVNKAFQRYSLPRLRASPSPAPDIMADIQVHTPRSTEEYEPTGVVQGQNRLCGIELSSDVRSGHYHIEIPDLPFVNFQRKLDKLCKALKSPLTIVPSMQYLEKMLPLVAHQLFDEPRTVTGNQKTFQLILQRIEGFCILFRRPESDSPFHVFKWLIEFVVIGSSNQLFQPYQDDSLKWLIEGLDTQDLVDEFFILVRTHNLFSVVDKILGLKTITAEIFASKALLTSIMLEDERLIDLVLSHHPPLNGSRKAWDGCYVSAIHLAVEQQNLNLTRRLLKDGIDPDGYSKEEDYIRMKPLSRLAYLRSLNNEMKVTYISETILEIVLSAQREIYGPLHCEHYLKALFFRAWAADTIDLLNSLRCYCRSMTHDSIVLPVPSSSILIAVDTDVDETALELTATSSESVIKQLDIPAAAVRKRCLPVLKHTNCNFENSASQFSSSDITWLLGIDIQISHLSYRALLYRAMEAQDRMLCKKLMDAGSIRMDTINLIWNFYWNCTNPNAGFTIWLAQEFVDRRFCSWAAILAAGILVGEEKPTNPYGLTVNTYLTVSRSQQREEDLTCVLDEVVHRHKIHSHDLNWTRLKTLLEAFGPDSYSIASAVLLKHGISYRGDALIFRAIVDSGVHLTKSLLLAFCQVGGKDDLTTSALQLDFGLSLSDLLDRPVAEVAWYRSHDQALKVLRLFERIPALRTTQWVSYVLSKGGTPVFSALLRILPYGFKCVTCETDIKCHHPIVAAVQLGDLDLVKSLIADGFEIGCRSAEKSTCSFFEPPVGFALDARRFDIVEVLLHAGIDPDTLIHNHRGARTILHEASWIGHVRIVCMLLEAGANVTGRVACDFGTTALENASYYGRLDVAHVLANSDGNSRLLRHDIKRAARLARMNNQDPLAKMLEERAKVLEGRDGCDDIDVGIDELCDCQIRRSSFHCRCENCKRSYPSTKQWYGSLLYYTHASLGKGQMVFVNDELTGLESLEELEDMVEDVCSKNSDWLYSS
ncbi:hypothetical protein MMC10_002881 [Thelotrema lepadinum]|nr:hypothetical protein [Thelotrema lepadinum]